MVIDDGLAQAHSLELFELGQCSVEVGLKMTFSGSPRVSGGDPVTPVLTCTAVAAAASVPSSSRSDFDSTPSTILTATIVW
jgi:hypothetical protein